MLNIALLVCGGISGSARQQIGADYPEIYEYWLKNSRNSLPHKLTCYDVVHKMEYPDDLDVLMLTGSAASAYEDIEWINKLCDFVARIVHEKPHVKLIGICFGHQIIARALGGVCAPNAGRWELGPIQCNLTHLGKQLFGGVNSLSIQQLHRDHVPTPPPNFELLASSEITPNQGMVRFYPSSSSSSSSLSTPSPSLAPTSSNNPDVPSNPNTDANDTLLSQIHILTLQGHPEFTERILSAIVAQRAGAGVIGAEARGAYERVKDDGNDGLGRVGGVV